MSNKLLWVFIKLMWFLERIHFSFLAKFVSFFIRIFFSAQIPPEVKVGSGTVFGYGALAVVLHKDSVIGVNCRIGSGVTLGSRNPDIGAPDIGDNTFVATGAKVLGGIQIGKDCVIAANAVVVSDVPDRSIVAGIPAKVIKSDIDISLYNESFY